MKLIKINPDHYVIVDDSPIEEGGEIEKGDWYYLPRTNYVYLCEENPTELNLERHCGTAKVTHSTRPIEDWIEAGILMGKKSEKIKPLKLSEAKELIGEMDVGKKAREFATKPISPINPIGAMTCLLSQNGFENGYNQALEDNKEKKYTEKDIKAAIHRAGLYYDINGVRVFSDEQIIQSLQPKTEWEVEFVDGKLKLK